MRCRPEENPAIGTDPEQIVVTEPGRQLILSGVGIENGFVNRMIFMNVISRA
ncbi:MAG: hypothetical protein ACPIFQ_00460 [Candidatus Puniceispirillaceae bacterium]|jgi:hypothetical protein